MNPLKKIKIRQQKGFAAFPFWALNKVANSLLAKGVYLELCRWADSERGCWPSVKTLADGMGISVPHVNRGIKMLRDTGAITIKSGKTGGESSEYNMPWESPVIPQQGVGHSQVIDPSIAGDPPGSIAGDRQTITITSKTKNYMTLGSNAKRVLDDYFREFELHLGEKMVVNGAREIQNIKRLFERGFSPEEIARRREIWFSMTTGFGPQCGWSFSGFYAKFNALGKMSQVLSQSPSIAGASAARI